LKIETFPTAQDGIPVGQNKTKKGKGDVLGERGRLGGMICRCGDVLDLQRWGSEWSGKTLLVVKTTDPRL